MIKEVRKNDIPECVEVIRESFLTIANEFGFTEENAPRFTAFATNKERLYWHYDNVNRYMYAYYDGEKLVGYYSLVMVEDSECELQNLCVLPYYRHKGIGKELLQHAFDQAREKKCVKINIGIVEENKVLRRWYESNGFYHKGAEKLDFFPFTCGYMERNL